MPVLWHCDCCRFLSPVLGSLPPGVFCSAPCSRLFLLSLVVLPVLGLCSLKCGVGKVGRSEMLWAVICRAQGEGVSSHGVSLFLIWRFLHIGFLELGDGLGREGSAGKAPCLPKEACSAAVLGELWEFQSSCVGGEEGFVVELLGIKKGWNLASQKRDTFKTRVKFRHHLSQWQFCSGLQ